MFEDGWTCGWNIERRIENIFGHKVEIFNIPKENVSEMMTVVSNLLNFGMRELENKLKASLKSYWVISDILKLESQINKVLFNDDF